MPNENTPVMESFLDALGDDLVKSYQELIIQGPLSVYFTLVEEGYFDAAEKITPDIKSQVVSFVKKIEEILASSSLIEALMLTADSQESTIKELRKTVEMAVPILSQLQGAAKAVREAQKAEKPAEENAPEGDIEAVSPEGVPTA